MLALFLLQSNVMSSDNDNLKKPNLLQTTGSVLAGLFGVQSARTRERDFKQGDPLAFIAVYSGLVIVLIVAVAIAVKLAMP